MCIFRHKLALYIYIRNVVPDGNQAARFMLSFREYAELDAHGPLFGKIFSIAKHKIEKLTI